ncbi:23S rRNA (adenine(2503)-C(2))-methyltransferase RlmN [Candidatus Riflebacteria bacterium]
MTEAEFSGFFSDNMQKEGKNSFSALSIPDLQEIMQKFDMRTTRYPEILKPIFFEGIESFSNVRNVKRDLKHFLLEKFYFDFGKVKTLVKSEDGAEKLFYKFPDGNGVEVVLLESSGRKTLCLSTQVGCRMACSICRTHFMGLKRQLTAMEIISPYLCYRFKRGINPDNLVFMGMGEPLDNFQPLVEALKLLINPGILSFPPRHITVSTVGLIPRIRQLDELNLKIKLTVSLNAADNTTRNKIIPLNRKYPLEMIIKTLKEVKNLKPICLAYVLIDGLNDSEQEIEELAKFALAASAKVNLIPFNSFPESEFMPSSAQRLEKIWQYLVNTGVSTRLRITRGQSIQAACGQLLGQAGEPWPTI